jgi:hypothetical protein
VQLAEIAGVELGEGDARHQVAAEDRLGVEARHRPELLARLQLDQRGDHGRGADVDGEAEAHGGGVAALDGQHVAPERRHRDRALLLAQRLRQGGEHGQGHGARVEAGRGGERFEVGGLPVLLARQRDRHAALDDAGVDGHARQPRARRGGAEDLERLLLDRRRQLHGHGLARRALAREPVAFADQLGTELHLVHDRRRRDRAGQELHPARRAAAAAAAGGGDVDRRGVRGPEDRRARRQAELAARAGVAGIGEDDEGDRHAGSL